MSALAEQIAALRRQAKQQLQAILPKLKRGQMGSLRNRVISAINRRINAEGWMERIIRARFDAESAHNPGGPSWAPLTQATIASRISKGFGSGPILVNTGRLREGAIRSVSGTFSLTSPQKWTYLKTGVYYAKWAGDARPYLQPPNKAEIAPVLARCQVLMGQEIRRILD